MSHHLNILASPILIPVLVRICIYWLSINHSLVFPPSSFPREIQIRMNLVNLTNYSWWNEGAGYSLWEVFLSWPLWRYDQHFGSMKKNFQISQFMADCVIGWHLFVPFVLRQSVKWAIALLSILSNSVLPKYWQAYFSKVLVTSR